MILKTQSKKAKIISFFSNPARVIVSSFAMLIIIGTLLLMLPVSSKHGQWMGLVPALFTATSATCVTGLVVVDTYTYFSLFGQLVILALIQMGGLGLVTFATFFNIAIRKKVALKTLYMAQESTNSDSMDNIRQLLKLIFTFTFAFEIAGAIILSTVFVPQFGGSGLYIAIFLAISAYCNAGFDVLGFLGPFSSLTSFNDNPVVLITIMALIIAGGLGFIVWQDLIHFRTKRHLMLHSKIILISTAVLIVGGAIMITGFEWNNPRTFGGMSAGQKILNGFFQSVTARTAGFNSFDINEMHGSSMFLTIVLMFVGAAPGGTGGGIKISTVFVLLAVIFSVFRGYDDATISNHKLDKSSVYKSLTVVFTAFLLVLLAATTIFFTTHTNGARFDEIDAIFEAASAFGTVGLTSGVTITANMASRIILTITMFIGRVGPTSLALSLAMRAQDKNKVMPDARIMVG